MKDKLKKIFSNKKLLFFVVLFVVLVQVCFVGVVDAQASSTAAEFMAWASGFLATPHLVMMSFVMNVVVWMMGGIISLATDVLMKVASYNNFAKETLVSDVWSMVRDLCNMFFILILLVIAFATMLRIPSYEMKKALPKLLIMAVLINFSKTICALIIDFSQVLMLSFVNAFQGGQLIDALGVREMFSIKTIGEIVSSNFKAGVNPLEIFGTQAFSLILLTIATIVIVSFVLILMTRVITLWVLVMLSPIAFLLSAFPAGQKYASKWWVEFAKTVTVGPIIAFFLWLALVAANSSGGITASFIPTDRSGITSNFISIFASEITDQAFLFKYIIVIVFLVVGLKMAQEAGGAMGNIAGKGLGAARKVGNIPLWAGKELGFKAGRELDKLQMTGQKKLAGGIGFADYAPRSLNYRSIKKGWENKKAEEMAHNQKVKNLDFAGFNKFKVIIDLIIFRIKNLF